MNLQEIKVLARLTGDQDDAYLSAVLPIIKDAIRNFTGKPYRNEQNEDDFSPLAKMALVKWVQMFSNPAGIASQSTSGVSYSYDLTAQGIPEPVRELLAAEVEQGAVDPARKFTFVQMPPRKPRIGVPESKESMFGGGWNEY